MGVTLYRLIEVRDDDGNWHLVKFYSPFMKVKDYNDHKPDNELKDGLQLSTIVEHWRGLSLRDRLGGWYNHDLNIIDKIPDDASEETKKYLHDLNESVKTEWSNGFNFHSVTLNEINAIIYKDFDYWKENVIKQITEKSDSKILQKIEKLEKLMIPTSKNVLLWSKKYWDRSHQFGEEEYSQQDINEAFNQWNWAERDLKEAIKSYEEPVKESDTEDYYDYLDELLSDEIWSIIGLNSEYWEIYTLANMFLPWVKEDNVRIIYYFD